MTYTSNLSNYGASASDRADPGSWFLTKDEPLLAEYVNFLFHNLIEDAQWSVSMLNAIDPDEDGQVSDSYTLRGKSPSELGGFKYIQNATPSASKGASWFKDSNGLLFVHNGTKFETQPEVAYDETNSFDNKRANGYNVAHETVPRTEVRADGSMYLIPELVVADFEDTYEPNLSLWSWTAGTSTLTAQGTTVIGGGTQSLQMESVGATETATLARNAAIIQDFEMTFAVGSDTSNINDSAGFEVADGAGTRLAVVTYNDGAGNVTLTHGDGSGNVVTTELMASWTGGTATSYEFDWDFAADQFDLYLDGVLEGTFAFEAAAADFGQTTLTNDAVNSGATRSVYADDIHSGARETGEAVITCPEPDERIVDWDIVRLTRTLAAETVQVDVEDETGTALTTDINTNDDLSAFVAATTNPQFRITLSRTDTANDPSFDSIYRRWTHRPGDTGLSNHEKQNWKTEDNRARYIHTRLATR